jgi:hypothetical protein
VNHGRPPFTKLLDPHSLIEKAKKLDIATKGKRTQISDELVATAKGSSTSD